jgi:hypothetical protein
MVRKRLWLTSLRVDRHAKTCLLLENERVLPESEADYLWNK